jgi:uncharacterized damage-inducible protein DinB
MTRPLERMLRYDQWANGETLRSLQQRTAPTRSLRWLGHIIGAEFLWLSRIEGKPSQLPIWPELSLDQCERRLNEISKLELERFAGGAGGPLDRAVSYTNSKGEAWTNTLEEILTHLVIHSAYHRGQIASDLRAAGAEPAYTDYIHAVRQGMVE